MSVRQPTLQDMQCFNDEAFAHQWLVDLGLSSIGRQCQRCQHGAYRIVRGEPTLRCDNRSCRARCPIFKGTFFEKIKLPIGQAIFLGYLWVQGTKTTAIERMTGVSHETACQYKRHCEELVSYVVEDSREKIGGPGIIVEMDESKFGHRKYNRGHCVDSPWVVGGVERTPARRMFALTVTHRDGELLATVISDHIEPGSILLTDCWRGYVRAVKLLRDQGFEIEHRVVNHSEEFVAEDGTHTNTIEATWAGIKRTMTAREKNTDSTDTKLQAFVWRRRNANDLWGGLVRAWQTIRYGEE